MSGSSRQTTTSSQQTSPWAPQAGALTQAMNEAQSIYGQTAGSTSAPENFVEGFNPDQLATFRKMIGYGNNATAADQNAAAGASLTNMGVDATRGALSGFGSFDPNATNNPDALVSAANKYVAGQDIDSQVNNAMLNARQTAQDVTLPGINQNAARTGNTNSSRTGIAEGLVERGLAQQATDLGASLRSKAFSDGLTLASNNAQANNTSKLAALSGQAGAGTSAADLGRGALSGSIDDMIKQFGAAAAGGEGLRSADQANLDNQLKQYESSVNAPWANLRNYMDIIGSQVYGTNSNGTSTQTSTPSAWQVIGGLMGGAGSLFGRNGFDLFRRGNS